MIYCAHCKKPSVKDSGACPHCGKNVRGDKVASPPPTVAAPVQAAGAGSGADLDLDLGDEDGGSLELAADDYQPPPGAGQGGGDGDSLDPDPAAASCDPDLTLDLVESVPPPPMTQTPPSKEILESEVRKVGGYGSVQDGLMGTFKYGFRVRGRRKELEPLVDKAKADLRAAEENEEIALADLGRLAARCGALPRGVDEPLRLARDHDGALRSAMDDKEGLTASHSQKVGSLEEQISHLDIEAEPIRQEEIGASARYNEASTDVRRAEAKLKRANIEHRNLTEILAKRRAQHDKDGIPEADRARLAKEIEKLDAGRPELERKMAESQGEMEVLGEPLAIAQKVLEEVRLRLGEKNRAIAALRRDLDTLNREFQQAADAAGRKILGGSAQAQKAWAQVGLRVLQESPEVEALGEPLAQSAQKVALRREASRTVDVYEMALDSYDKKVYAASTKLLIQTGVGLGVVLAILIFLVLR